LAAASKLPLHLEVIISYAQIYLRVQSALHFIIDFENYIVKINDKNLNIDTLILYENNIINIIIL